MSQMKGSREDAPETPAHLFAYRAFKTAIFGTPAIKADDTVIEEPKEPVDAQIELILPLRKTEAPPQALQEPSKSTGSPIKSILLTPGTTAPTRKTVTFSGLRSEANPPTRNVPFKAEHQLTRQQSSKNLSQPRDILRRSLFQSSSSSCSSSSSSVQDSDLLHNESATVASKDRLDDPASLKQNDTSQIVNQNPIELDHTTDLKSPKSASGQHWKSEYQREHDKTKNEMKRLIRYSQIAKSYAAKRDSEASRMREKLEEAETKVQQLEEKVSQLASELGNVQLAGSSQTQLMKDLAAQTANAVRYKQKAARYRAALHDEKHLPMDEFDGDVQKPAATSSVDAKGDESNPRMDIVVETETMARLEEENATLRNTISRVKEEMLRYEERHQKWQETRRRRDERAAARRKTLEEKLERSEEENRRLKNELQTTQDALRQKQEPKPPKVQQPTVPLRSSLAERPTSQTDQEADLVVDRAYQQPKSKEPHLRSTQTLPASPVDARISPNITKIKDGSIKKRPVSMHLPEPLRTCRDVSPDSRDETLDIWSLAEGLATRPGLAVSRRVSAQAVDSNRRGDPPTSSVAQEALWESLKRRTSLSLMGNVRNSSPAWVPRGFDAAVEGDVPLVKERGDGVLDKENIDPCTL